MKFLYELFLGMGLSEKIADVLSFFIFEIAYLSVILMIGLIIFTFIRVRFLGEDFAERLNKKPKVLIYLGMALLGAVSPFCSCSTIPVFISFSALGIPTGALFVYLITSPMVQEASFILLLTEFGIPVAFIYVILGITAGVLAGILISKAKDSDRFTESTLLKRNNTSCCGNATQKNSCCGNSEPKTSCCGTAETTSTCCGDSKPVVAKTPSPFILSVTTAFSTFKSIFKYIALGIAIGAFIHGFVPDSVIQNLLGTHNIFAPIFATLVGIPIYADDVALIPIAKTLVDGGAGLGTALSFVMASAVVSIPSFIMLGAALKKKTLIKLAVFLTIAITVIGYIFNAISPFVI